MAEIKKPNRFSGLMQTLRQESETVASAESAVSLPSTPLVIVPSNQSTSQRQAEVFWVPLAKVHPDPRQDRRYFDEMELENMAASMRSVGIIDPLSVRMRPGTDDEYDLNLISVFKKTNYATYV